MTADTTSHLVRVLPDDVANKIAAGEVVERPASVVKELVENALDADATRITVDIERAGRRLIRVADNGCGMSRDNAICALQRHATSKVFTPEDIEAIATLGFRGEALPSIASVARFSLETATNDDPIGTAVRTEGGSEPIVTDVARAPGTTVSVRDLFFCVPARAKFLKTHATELSHIGRYVHTAAIANPYVGFTYTVDGRTQFDLPPSSTSTSFADALLTRITHLRGDDLVRDLLPLAYEHDTCAVSGYVSQWSRAVMNRQEIYLYVNGRPVYSPWLPTLLLRTYGSTLAHGAYPYAFIFLSLDPHTLDVNIHPAKSEVRFGHKFAVQSAITTAVTSALKNAHAAPQMRLSSHSPTRDIPRGANAPENVRVAPPPTPSAPWKQTLSVDEWKKLYGTPQKTNTPQESSAASTPFVTDIPSSSARAPSGQSVPPASPDNYNIVGQIGYKYIIAEMSGVRNGILLIDQHAAHERVNFDKACAAMRDASVPQQALLMPHIAHLSPAHAPVIKKALDLLARAGFSLEEFGVHTYKIDAVPADLEITDLDSLLASIADELMTLGSSAHVDTMRARIAAAIVCKRSVTFNQKMSLDEMRSLLNDLLATETPWTCPHGRPTMIVLPYDEVEKRFGRRH